MSLMLRKLELRRRLVPLPVRCGRFLDSESREVKFSVYVAIAAQLSTPAVKSNEISVDNHSE